MKLVDINWDIDDNSDINLPNEVEVPNNLIGLDMDELSDWLSETYGFLLYGFSIVY